MSLTSQLKNPKSPVRAFMSHSFPHFCQAGTRGGLGKEVAREYKFDSLLANETTIPIPEGALSRKAHAIILGTAFDLRVRMLLGQNNAANGIAKSGLRALEHAVATGPHLEGSYRALDQAVRTASELARYGDEEDLDIYCLLLAWCEVIGRVGVEDALEGRLGGILRSADDGDDLIASIDEIQLEDLANLRIGSDAQVSKWKRDIFSGLSFEPNPSFIGSPLVFGADADWMIGDTLIECKTTEQVSNPRIRDFILQLLGYTMLDFDDSLAIRKIGVWLPRQQSFHTWSLEEIIGEPVEDALPYLRWKFYSIVKDWREWLDRREQAFLEKLRSEGRI